MPNAKRRANGKGGGRGPLHIFVFYGSEPYRATVRASADNPTCACLCFLIFLALARRPDLKSKLRTSLRRGDPDQCCFVLRVVLFRVVVFGFVLLLRGAFGFVCVFASSHYILRGCDLVVGLCCFVLFCLAPPCASCVILLCLFISFRFVVVCFVLRCVTPCCVVLVLRYFELC